MVASTLLVDTAIAQILPNLPAGTGYNVRRMDPTVFPIISYALQSDTMSPVALRDLAQYQIVPLLSSIAGLARVNVQGGETAEVEVLADPHRLAAYGLGMTDLADALAKGNVLQAVGQLQDHHKLYLVLADPVSRKTERSAMSWCASDPSRRGPGARCRHGAGRHRAAMDPRRRGRQARRAVQRLRAAGRQRGADRRSGAARSWPSFKLPAGVHLVNWYDQSELVTQSAGSVRDAVLIGLVLAALVLMLFLRSWRVTLIAMLVVPATLAATVLVLSLLGMSFNIMTLGGIAAAVGLLIDDVIVMVEHIARRAGAPHANGGRRRQRRGAAGRPRVPAAADRLQPRHADRVPAAELPQRRHRRVLQGAVGHDGCGAGDLLPDDRLRRAGAGAASGRFRPLARSGCGRRRLADAVSMGGCSMCCSAALGCWASRWCRCWCSAGSPTAQCRPVSCRRSTKAAS